MAEVIKDLETKLRPRITVDEKTAKVCLQLVEIFLNDNKEYNFTSKRTCGELKMEIKKYGNE